ncbi:unnamed protein product [Rotaria sp. Silwood2]|nr:unnamed protein product [Rotaria sp. Silwood2]
MPLNTKTTRLPLAIKPSNSTMSSSSSSTNQTLSPTTANTATNSPLSSISQSPSSLPLSKDTKLSSITTTRHKTSTMKKTKSISKAEIIKSELDEENIDNESGTEAQYDLATSIEESGGVDQFLETPCMILYKRNLTNQVDLENYILKHLSSYNTNKCLFAGVKGTDELKQKINEFYRQHRKKSMESTILFKGNSSRTTITQQILLKKGNLYLYVDGVMKNKTSRNKRKRVSVDLGSVRDVEKVHGNKCSGDDRKSETDFSTKNLKYVKSRNNNDNEDEKSDVEHTDDDASGTVNDATESDLEEGNEKEEEQNMIEDEIAAEETSQTNVLVGGTKRKHINWRGGSKNCGLYLLLHKNEEVKECVNNVLSYGREHGVLLTGVQLKVLLDIQNVEITKDRANAIVQLIASNVEVVSNPHFVAPTAQKSLFEYYGENFELGAVFPAKSIPIPRAIMIKCREDEKKRKKAGGGNKRKKEEKQPMEMMKEKHSTTYNSEDDEVMEIDDEKLNENKINSRDNTQDDKKENKKLNKNHSEVDRNNIKGGVSKNNDTLIDVAVLSEKNTNNDGSDNTDINSTSIESKIKNVVERCPSPDPGETFSSITVNTNTQLSPSKCTISTNNPASSSDTLHSASPQHSKTVDSTINTSPLPQQQSPPSQPKQKNVSPKKVSTAQETPKCFKRRSFGLRSKIKKKQYQLPIVKPSKRKQNDEDTNTAPLANPSKKNKVNNKKSARNYQALTKKFGKIPKKTSTSLTTDTSSNN